MATAAATQARSAAEVALAYHARTKHRIERYAAGPETLDWDTQPNPFREFAGCPRTALSLAAKQLGTAFAQVCVPGSVVPAPPTIDSLSTLMELSMGLSAWKEYGPDRWALRCNPSSGNLHPTEAYVFVRSLCGLDDGLYHYLGRDHALEQRCRATGNSGGPARLWIGLSSVHWREAWKYGERAFRYCQLDIGHALGALRYAAAALGWTATVVDEIGPAALAALMGLDRAEDFAGAEREDAELLIAIDFHHSAGSAGTTDMPDAWDAATTHWVGRANLLDPRPFYRWPVIDEASLATHGRSTGSRPDIPNYPPLRQSSEARAADLILARRSAQRFDPKFTMSIDVFYRLLDVLLARPIVPWDVWSFAPCIHPIFFVHRVGGLEPGLYTLPRRPGAARSLRKALRPDFTWRRLENAPAHLPIVELLRADCRAIARTVSCHQWIASDGCFSLGMLGEFEPIVKTNAWRYRQLHCGTARACTLSGGRSGRAARNRDRLLLR